MPTIVAYSFGDRKKKKISVTKVSKTKNGRYRASGITDTGNEAGRFVSNADAKALMSKIRRKSSGKKRKSSKKKRFSHRK